MVILRYLAEHTRIAQAALAHSSILLTFLQYTLHCQCHLPAKEVSQDGCKWEGTLGCIPGTHLKHMHSRQQNQKSTQKPSSPPLESVNAVSPEKGKERTDKPIEMPACWVNPQATLLDSVQSLKGRQVVGYIKLGTDDHEE